MLLPPGFVNNDGEYTLDNCPFCGKENHFNWNIYGEYGHCWVCDGSIVGYFNLTKAAPKLREVKIRQLFTYGRGFKNLRELGQKHYESAWDNQQARDYLISRNINEQTCLSVPFMWEQNSGVISVLLDPTSPELPPVTIYRWPKEESKWLVSSDSKKEKYAFNLHRFTGKKRSIVVCEGLFDIVSTGLLNDGIALCGSKASNSMLLWFEKNVNKIALWLDPDGAGEKGTKEISKNLDIYGIEYKIFSAYKDPKKYRWSDEEDRETLMEIKKYINE